MKKAENERRCLFCHKLLLDEKIPVCRRCKLEGRNKVGKVGGVVGGIGMSVLSAISLINNDTSGTDIDIT